MNGEGGCEKLGLSSRDGDSAKPALERLSLGSGRKETLQAGHSQTSPAGASASFPTTSAVSLVTPAWTVLAATSAAAGGSAEGQMSAFCQPEGEKRGKPTGLGEAKGKWREGSSVPCHLLPGVSAGSSAKVALQRPTVIICFPPLPRIWTDSPCCLIPQGLRPEKRKVRTQESLQPVRSLLDGESEKGSPESCCCRHPAPHQTSDTFHFLRNKACLRDEVTHTAASGTGARRIGGGQGNGVRSLFCWPMPVWGGEAQSQSLPAPPSSTMKPALKGLGSEEDSSQEGDGVCHCCKGGRRKLEGCQGTYQPPSP